MENNAIFGAYKHGEVDLNSSTKRLAPSTKATHSHYALLTQSYRIHKLTGKQRSIAQVTRQTRIAKVHDRQMQRYAFYGSSGSLMENRMTHEPGTEEISVTMSKR